MNSHRKPVKVAYLNLSWMDEWMEPVSLKNEVLGSYNLGQQGVSPSSCGMMWMCYADLTLHFCWWDMVPAVYVTSLFTHFQKNGHFKCILFGLRVNSSLTLYSHWNFRGLEVERGLLLIGNFNEGLEIRLMSVTCLLLWCILEIFLFYKNKPLI